MNTQITIPCPMSGFEDVKVTYNLMGTEEDFNEWGKSLGGQRSGLVIASVTGWDEEQYGRDPFGPRSPMAFRVWACESGLKQAFKAFVADPNS